MEKDIGKIKKNSETDIVLRLDDFGGRPGLTIREFTNTEKYKGFTKSGTRIPLDSLPLFRDLINSINLESFKFPESQKFLKKDTLGSSELKEDEACFI